MLIAFSYVWNLQMSAQQWSWVRQFGTTSLLVYWVHVELVYGRWLSPFKENLSVGETITAAAGVIVMMLGLSALRTNWAYVRNWFGSLSAAPRRVSGD
jgi:fucose 4-O-acetylase-like acetyltransferase